MFSNSKKVCFASCFWVVVAGAFMGCGTEETVQGHGFNAAQAPLSQEADEPASTDTEPSVDKARHRRLDKSTDFGLYRPHGKAHWPGDEDDPRMVRETGFQPIDEDDDDPRYVRETGFLPSPRIRLARLNGPIAVIEWNQVDGAGTYALSGIRFGHEGAPAESFDLRIVGTQARVNTNARVTQVIVVAVSEDGSARSRPSNKLSVNPDFD
jgi:hypothetical protein